MREDDRSLSSELRRMTATLGVVPCMHGSAEFRLGLTRVLASINGPREPLFQRQQLVDEPCVEVTVTPSSGPRTKFTQHLQHSLSVCLAKILDATVLAGCLVSVYVQIVQDDGGVASACMNACVLAFLEAGIPLHCTPVAVTIGKKTHTVKAGQEVPLPSPALVVDPCLSEQALCSKILSVTCKLSDRSWMQILPTKGTGLSQEEWSKAAGLVADCSAVTGAFFRATVKSCVASLPLVQLDND